MSSDRGQSRLWPSLLTVWLIALSGLAMAFPAVTDTARAGQCDQVGGVITGDWTISTTQVCSGIVYKVDGTVTINSGGSLTLVNGGLEFEKDRSHEGYSLIVNAGGQLILDGSIVTTDRYAIAPYLHLALTVSGSLTMNNGASLKFPGWLNATGATIGMSDATITGFTSTDLSGLGIYQDENDDGPAIAWASSTVSMYRSRIERIYENTSGNISAMGGSVRLTATSNLYAYDSYIGADYSNVQGLHNELRVDATSNAYLYDVTIDRDQDPVSRTDWQPAFVPQAAGGTIYLLRWLRAYVVDSTGFPVSGATIWSSLSPSSVTAQYPDNVLSATPSARTLSYLGRTATGPTAWNRTDSGGVALIPLYTDQITTASLPNAESFGNYHQVLTYVDPLTSVVSTMSGGVSFNAYPALSDTDNTVWVTYAYSTLVVRSGPDLIVQSPYSGTVNVIQNQGFTVYAILNNQGQSRATGVDVGGYLDGSRTSQLARVNSLTVDISTPLNVTLSASGIGTLGAHTLELIVDPDNTINEGGPAQENNNFANITLNVLPPPSGSVAIGDPAAGATVEPGTGLRVTGYVTDTNSNPIPGVVLNIELRSGATAVASNTTMSADFGAFEGTIPVPSTLPDGPYTVVVTPTFSGITPSSRAITVQRAQPFLFRPIPIIGLPYWMFLLIIVAVVALAVGMTLYFKVYGLGKMVECGECGSFIPEDSTTCPKCGVEFEKDMAKCSNCQAWIPVDVKQCPECGVQFATGKVEMADYQEKMRLQYDEVVQKFRQEASRQLGRGVSDAEFQDWWRRQPTFVTFEDWLREEEEMRKAGSVACPVCTTLNSVTATVCHKCGSLMRQTRPSTRPPGPPPGPTPVAPKRVPKKPAEREGEGSAAASGDNASDV